MVLSGGCLPDVGWTSRTPHSSARRSANQDVGRLLAGLGDVPADIGRAWLADQLLGQIQAWSRRRLPAAAGGDARDDEQPPARLTELATAP